MTMRRAAAEPYLGDGAIWADRPEEAVADRQSEVVFASLPVPATSRGGGDRPQRRLSRGMKPDTAFFDMSTNSVSVVRKLNALFAGKNIYMLDLPVSGGLGGAASGKMAIWVGVLDEQQFNRYDQPVLGAMGDQAARYLARAAPARSPSWCITAPAR